MKKVLTMILFAEDGVNMSLHKKLGEDLQSMIKVLHWWDEAREEPWDLSKVTTAFFFWAWSDDCFCTNLNELGHD